MANNGSALIWRKFAKGKDFTQIFDSHTLNLFWMSFGKWKLRLRVKIELFLWKFPFNSNAIYNFWKTCKRFVWMNKILHQNAFWQLFHLHFNAFMRSDLKFWLQLNLNFHFHFIFAEKLRLLVCKVLVKKVQFVLQT